MTTAELAEICRSFPHAQESVKWGNDLVFTIGGKMFAILEMTEADFGRYSFKCEEGQFEVLSGQEGMMPAPYMARAKWVSVLTPDALSRQETRDFLENSYRQVFERLPKKVRTALVPI